MDENMALTPYETREILFYKTDNGDVKVEILLYQENLWLTQAKMAELFEVQKAAISKHLKNIFVSGELMEDSVVSVLETTAADGKKYPTRYYNLDAIIAVGYRVNSKKATMFRIWANRILKEYIIKGYVMDDERLKEPQNFFGKDYFEEQLERIRDIRASERRFYQKITDIYSQCSADYDVDSPVTKEFFATVQNKLHYAITKHTAAEIIYDRADSMANAPRYLLLFGNCAYDNRMITTEWKKHNPDDYLLAYERSDEENKVGAYGIGTIHDYVTDDYYALLDDGEGNNIASEKIDLGVGRFLCTTEIEAKILVDQTITYITNEHVGPWKNRMWAIADVGNNNLHMSDAQSVCQQTAQSADEGFMVRRIYPDAYSVVSEAKGNTYPEATSKLKRAMQQGALIFNYNGHGSPKRISNYFLLDRDEMSSNVSSALPIWIFASCEITPYDQQSDGDMGRNAIYNRGVPLAYFARRARSTPTTTGRLTKAL